MLWLGAFSWIWLCVLGAVLLLVILSMLFLHYMRRIIVERDLNYDGEDKKDIPLSQRFMARVIPVLRIGHSKVTAWWYGHPSDKIKLVGVTGTNGKTTIATVLYELFRKMGHRCGLISTVSVYIDDKEMPAVITTPGAVELNRLMSKMVKAGCEYVFMECSSHGLVHKRINGLHFSGAIFTNLTRDHLDYHRTFENYRNAKKSFFDMLPLHAFALINADDENSSIMVRDCKATVKTYSIDQKADFMVAVVSQDINGMQLKINGREVKTRLLGRFNAINLLAVYGAAVMLGKKPDEILAVMPEMKSVRGRLDPVRLPNDIFAFVDYAHSPDALRNVLTAIHEVIDSGARVVTVCGAGGNRDKGKRPMMALEAVKQSDHVILTSDNPRFENPQDIINDMLTGLDSLQKEHVTCVVNRREAIRQACLMARKGDVVLVAGKGHEEYQEIKGERQHFSDHEVLCELITPIASNKKT